MRQRTNLNAHNAGVTPTPAEVAIVLSADWVKGEKAITSLSRRLRVVDKDTPILIRARSALWRKAAEEVHGFVYIPCTTNDTLNDIVVVCAYVCVCVMVMLCICDRWE